MHGDSGHLIPVLGKLMTEALASVSSVGVESTDEEARKAHQLPVPQGYKILISLPEPEKVVDSTGDGFPSNTSVVS